MGRAKEEKEGLWEDAYDHRPEIRRILANGQRVVSFPGETLTLLAVTAPNDGPGDVRVEVNRLMAFVAPVSVLHAAHVRLLKPETRIVDSAVAVGAASEALRRIAGQAKNYTEARVALKELASISTALATATQAWGAYLGTLLEPCRFVGLPPLSYEHEIVIRTAEGFSPVEVDLYCLVRRATTF